MCDRERERKRERETKRERKRDRARERERERERESLIRICENAVALDVCFFGFFVFGFFFGKV